MLVSFVRFKQALCGGAGEYSKQRGMGISGPSVACMLKLTHPLTEAAANHPFAAGVIFNTAAYDEYLKKY